MSEAFPGEQFATAGLNRQHVFALAALPDDIRASLGDCRPYRQLILLGHAGRLLWECVKSTGLRGEDPIDDYVIATVNRNFRDILPGTAYRILYPATQDIRLQALGQLAGWHCPSPFMVGIDPEWGSWFAYRAVVLADTDFTPSPVLDQRDPCRDCRDKPCIGACPPGALASGKLALDTCSTWRQRADSPCAHTCLARLACPVGAAHRYDADQLRHSYARSLHFCK